jgi:hypothetical protein
MDLSGLYVPLADQATDTLTLCQSRYLRARGQAVPQIQALARRAIFPRLDMSSHQHALGAERQGFQPAEDAPLAAIAQHIHGEHMLPNPGRGQDNLLDLFLRLDAFAGTLGDLLLESSLQRGCSR